MLRLVEFQKKLKECSDKSSERQCIDSEINAIKQSFEKNQTSFRARNLAKLLYLKTIRQNINFGQKQIVLLLGSNYFIEKELAYLGLTMYMDIQIINQCAQIIKEDLQSKTYKIMRLALSALGQIIHETPNLISYLKQQIKNCVKFNHVLIQKKAILVIATIAKVLPSQIKQFSSHVFNAVRLNQIHLFPQCLIFFKSVMKSQQATSFSNKINEIIPQILTIYSNNYEKYNNNQQFTSHKFLLESLLTLLKSLKTNQKVQKFLSQYIEALLIQHNQNKNSKVNEISSSLLRVITSLPNNNKNRKIVGALLKNILSLKNSNKVYLSLQALKLTWEFDQGMTSYHTNFIISALQSCDLSNKILAISLLYEISQKSDEFTIEEKKFYNIAIHIAEYLQMKENMLKGKYSSLLKVLILIIQSQSNSFIFGLLQQITQIKKLKQMQLTSLFFQGVSKNPVDHFFSLIMFLIDQWGKTVVSSEEEFQIPEVDQISMQGKIITMIQSLFTLQNVQKDNLLRRISFLYTISLKISNKCRIRQVVSQLTKSNDQEITKTAIQILSKFDDSFPKSMIVINQSSIRPINNNERKYSRQRLNSCSSDQQYYNKHDQSHLLKQIQDSKNEIAYQSLYQQVLPVKIQILLQQTGCTEIQLGDARILQVLFYSGNDNRNDDSFKNVTERQVQWFTQPNGIVQIDMYGRLKTLKSGNVQITVQSLSNQQAKDSKRVCVTDKKFKKKKITKKRVLKYEGTPAQQIFNWQKIVHRYQHYELQSNQYIPKQIKEAILLKKNKIQFTEGLVTWRIQKFADGSEGKYVKRVDSQLQDGNRDKIQYFMGDRYLPDDGKSPISIQPDQENGIWIIGQSGNIIHITMNKINYANKAIMMSKDTDKYVSRYGLTSNADWNGQRWTTGLSDNDGLWTGMYGVGQLMRYHVLKNSGASSQMIKQARSSALRSLKSVLLIGNVSGRDGTTKATIRYLTNTRLGTGYWYSDDCLKQGKAISTDIFVGNPSEGINFYGVDAGKTTDKHYCGGKYRYNMQSINKDDWIKYQDRGSTPIARTEKSLKGYISRTFGIKQFDKSTGGLMFQRNQDGTQTVLSSANTLYDYSQNDHPVLNIGNIQIPEVLKDVIFVNGKQYQAKDLIYKADCSTDEIIGHLFIYKVGYDIMDESDSQQKAVKNVIRDTIVNYAQHLLDNGYTLVDATGQPAKWGKTNRQFFNSDASIQQGNMQCLILLMAFKLAYYMTNQARWQDQYLLLINHKAMKFLDFSTTYWDHWMYMIMNQDNSPESNLYHLKQQDNPSQVQKQAHALYCVHYSDQEMAMLVFYLCFQLESDLQLLKKYQKALDAWWVSVSHSENPLWYYIYQLSKPTETVKDAYGNNILQTASWQLSRHPISTIQYKAYFDGSRPDVIKDFKHSVDPTKIIGKRTSQTDIQNASNPSNFKILSNYDPKNIHQIKVLPADERSIHKMNGTTFRDISASNSKSMQPATTYTTPYWFGVYHGMLKFNPPQ